MRQKKRVAICYPLKGVLRRHSNPIGMKTKLLCAIISSYYSANRFPCRDKYYPNSEKMIQNDQQLSFCCIIAVAAELLKTIILTQVSIKGISGLPEKLKMKTGSTPDYGWKLSLINIRDNGFEQLPARSIGKLFFYFEYLSLKRARIVQKHYFEAAIPLHVLCCFKQHFNF